MVIAENAQCLPALILLLRAIEARIRLDWETADAFRTTAGHHIPPSPPVTHPATPPGGGGGGSNAPPLWRRSLAKWMRVILDHENFISDLMVSVYILREWSILAG